MNTPFLTNSVVQQPSPVANAGGSAACYPPPLSPSGERAAIANDREIGSGSAPQMGK